MKTFKQDPQDKLFYKQALNNDIVASADWTISPAAQIDMKSHDSSAAYCRVSGLAAGQDYKLTCHIVAQSGQEWDRSCLIKCEEM